MIRTRVPLVAAFLTVLGLLLSLATPAAAAVGRRLDNDDDSDRSVKVYKSAGCYDNPNLNDTKVIGPGRSTEEFGGWSNFQSYRLYADARIEVVTRTDGRWLYDLWVNVPTGGSVCRNFQTDNRFARVFTAPGLVNSTVVKTAPGVTVDPIGHTPQAGPLSAQKNAYDDAVGLLTGFYKTASEGGPLYYGVKQPAGNWTVWVQRKTLSTGVWTLDGVYDPSHNTPAYAESWQIRDAGYISNTTAIRLYRPTTGQFVVLCVNKAECLAM